MTALSLPERVLVLGGTGFLGSEIAREFQSAGSSVTVAARHRPTGQVIRLLKDTELIAGDIRDPLTIGPLVDKCDHVVFAVGTMLPQESNANPSRDISTAIPAVLSVLEALKRRPSVRFTYLSSGGTVYGNPTKLPVSESTLCRPINSYGIVKRAAEMYIEMYSTLHGMPARILRVGNAYGPLQPANRTQGVIGTLLRAAYENTPMLLFGDGETVRDYVHVSDVARVAVALAQREGGPDVVNVGSGVGYSVRELLELVRHVTGAHLDIQETPDRGFDVREIVLDVSLLSSLMRWEPMPLAEGIIETWDALSARRHPRAYGWQ